MIGPGSWEGERLLSLHDTTTEILCGVGAEGELIAIVEPLDLSSEASLGVARVDRIPAGPFSAEALLALHPTQIFGSEAILESQPELGRALENAGVRSHFIDPVGWDGLCQSILQVGHAVGRSEAAAAWTEELGSALPDPPPASEMDPDSLVRVFFYDCCDPPFTAGGRVPLSELLERIGARNIFDDLDQDWSRVSWEAVIQRQPELIVVHDYSHAGQGTLTTKLDRLRQAPLGGRLPAVRSNALVAMPLALALEGPRCLEALPLLTPYVNAAREARVNGGEEHPR